MVQIGLKVDTLDALRLKERSASERMPRATVDGGCDIETGAGLVLLQDLLSSPLVRAACEQAPMSRLT